MKGDHPTRIALAAKTLARLEYQLSHLRLNVWANRRRHSRQEAATARCHLRVLRLKRSLAAAELERLKNEFRLTISDLSTAG